MENNFVPSTRLA